MKNSYWVALLTVCTVSFVLGVANASPLVSEKYVKQVWEDQIEKALMLLRSGDYIYNSQGGYWSGWDLLAEAGYVELQKKKLYGWEQFSAGGDSAVNVTFTEKFLQETLPLSKSPSLSEEAMVRFRCALWPNRQLDRIVDISPGHKDGESIALVAATYPKGAGSSVAQAATDGSEESQRYRYRLTFKYDPFLEEHRFMKLEWSPWEQEVWKVVVMQAVLSSDGQSCIHQE